MKDNIKNPIPRIAAIHDLSSFGRCALTVVMPTLSAMGMQVVPIPTALLSTHTGGFTGMSFLDLDGEMQRIGDHFASLGLCFDAIYTGFLGSAAQIETVERFIERFGGEGCCVFIDPVMGDDGALYSTYTDELVMGIKRLCHASAVLTPNLTEACILTDTPYPDTVPDRETALVLAESLCRKLYGIYGCEIALTGLHFDSDRIATCTLSGGRFSIHEDSRIGRNYPGTGDLFASVMLGHLLSGADFETAAEAASRFTRRAIEYSETFAAPARDGVVFEPLLKELGDRS